MYQHEYILENNSILKKYTYNFINLKILFLKYKSSYDKINLVAELISDEETKLKTIN